MFIIALFIIAKAWKQPSAHQQMVKKMLDVCVCVYYSAINENELLPFLATWIHLEDIMPSEMSDREVICIYIYIYICYIL